MVPLPPEVESLPRGIPVDGAILSGFSGQSPVALGHQPDEMPRLRLVAQVTLAVRHFMAFELIETIAVSYTHLTLPTIYSV